MKMKIPISKELTETFIMPCIAITGVGIYDLYTSGQYRFAQNIVFIILFGIPTILLSWLLIDKRAKFKDNQKVSKNERAILLPFSSFSITYFTAISSVLLVGGLALLLGDKDTSIGLLMLVTGLFILTLISIAVDNPKIWFSDSYNIEEELEIIKNIPQENFPAYQDGIFSYFDNSFTIQLEKEFKTINWNEITLIRAYKIDKFSYDCIVIEIYLTDTVISINDQTVGHMKFMETASDKLCNFKEDWFTVVAFPAFETNLTIIYEKMKEDNKKGSH